MKNHKSPYRVICFGEVLWDCFPGRRVPGGAPLNVAYHLSKANCRATVVSAVGDDDLGTEMLATMRQWDMDTTAIRIHEGLPTGTVEVALEDGIPSYTISDGVAWDEIASDASLSTLATGNAPAAIVFGSLAQRTTSNRKSLEALLTIYPDAMRVFDVNLREPHSDIARVRELLSKSDLVKVNDEELQILTQDQLENGSIEARAKNIADRFNCRAVCVTRGKDGASLLERGTWTDVEATPVNAVDTVGAGDAFLAALLAGFGRDNLDRVEALNRATKLAGYVATQPGATPDY